MSRDITKLVEKAQTLTNVYFRTWDGPLLLEEELKGFTLYHSPHNPMVGVFRGVAEVVLGGYDFEIVQFVDGSCTVVVTGEKGIRCDTSN
jgi:uncharacterized protein YjlB